jgi:hypothetical protein
MVPRAARDFISLNVRTGQYLPRPFGFRRLSIPNGQWFPDPVNLSAL